LLPGPVRLFVVREGHDERSGNGHRENDYIERGREATG
jgi:hypothetical protein